MGKGWFHIKSGEADRLKPPTRRTFFDKQQLAPVESVGEAQLFTPFTIHEPALGPSKSLAATPTGGGIRARSTGPAFGSPG